MQLAQDTIEVSIVVGSRSVLVRVSNEISGGGQAAHASINKGY